MSTKEPIRDENDVFSIMKDIMEKMGDRAPSLRLPPLCAEEFKIHYTEYIRGKSLTAVFPVPEKYCNPADVLQGGVLCAYFDNVFGPFAFLEARAYATSLDLNTNYIRPVKPNEEIRIHAEIKGRGKDTLNIYGEALNKKNKLLATATSNMYIFKFK